MRDWIKLPLLGRGREKCNQTANLLSPTAGNNKRKEEGKEMSSSSSWHSLDLSQWTTRAIAVLIAGVCVVLATLISLYCIYKHLRNYTRPKLQRCIVRILFMVPVRPPASRRRGGRRDPTPIPRHYNTNNRRHWRRYTPYAAWPH